jgi:hypothetical protein
MLKHSLLLSLLLSLSGFAQNLDEIFQEGKVNGNLRAFWFDGDRDLRHDRTALSVGGILNYQTASFHGLQGNVSFYSSNGVTSLTRMPEAGQTGNLLSDGSSINTLGEAALSYTVENTIVKYGRQRLSTPLTNDFYDRMLPNSFEALNIENNSMADLSLKGAYITKWKFKDSDTFLSPTQNFGFNENISMVGAVSKKWGMSNEIYNYYIPDGMNALYLQSESPNLLGESAPYSLTAKFQYLYEKGIGEKLFHLSSTSMFGGKLILTYDDWFFTAMGSVVGKQALIGTGGNGSKMGWGSFLPYTGMQIDGGEENAGAIAYGAITTHRFDKSFEATLKYLHIDQSDKHQRALDSLTDNPRPDSDEYNFDTTYQPSKSFRLRCRFAYLDYHPKTTDLYQHFAFDEFNTRIIADYLF